MPRFLTICFLFGATLALPAALPRSVVVNTTISPTPDGQRFLFLVDTSSSMERLQSEVEATIYDVICSGVGGYMRAGDTYGLWTFNKQAYPGRFAMQVWDPRKVSPLGTIAAAFLSEQTYEKSSNVKQVIASLGPVVRAVSNFNVLIISDGAAPMHGTPFDDAINADYKKKNRERRNLKRPFITTLIVRDGWFVKSSVSIAGQPIPMPDRPLPEIAMAKTNLTPVAKAQPVTKPMVVHTAIVDAIPNPKAAPTSSVPGVVATAAPEAPPVNEPAKTSDGNRVPVVGGATQSTSGSPASLVEPQNRKVLQITTLPRSIPTDAPAHPPESVPVPSESVLRSATRATDAVASVSSPAPLPPSPDASPAAQREAAVETPPSTGTSLAANALAVLAPTPIPIAARELDPGPDPVEPTPGAMQAMTAPTQEGLNPGLMLAFGGVLLAATLFLLLATVRRNRPVPQGSLITQSMDTRTMQRR